MAPCTAPPRRYRDHAGTKRETGASFGLEVVDPGLRVQGQTALAMQRYKALADIERGSNR
jgi:hypothetical protein